MKSAEAQPEAPSSSRRAAPTRGGPMNPRAVATLAALVAAEGDLRKAALALGGSYRALSAYLRRNRQIEKAAGALRRVGSPEPAPPAANAAAGASPEGPPEASAAATAADGARFETVRAALVAHGGNQTRAAAALKVRRQTLAAYIRRHPTVAEGLPRLRPGRQRAPAAAETPAPGGDAMAFACADAIDALATKGAPDV